MPVNVSTESGEEIFCSLLYLVTRIFRARVYLFTKRTRKALLTGKVNQVFYMNKKQSVYCPEKKRFNRLIYARRCLLTVFLFLAAFLTACQQRGLYDYSTPESTYRTYIEQARTLRIVADHRHYRRAIRCFTDSDRRWFEKNFDKIPIEREDHLYSDLYRTKQQAYVFGRAVVAAGPDPDEEKLVFTEVSPDVTELEVEGYERTIKFVRTGRGWLIKGLFGLRQDSGI